MHKLSSETVRLISSSQVVTSVSSAVKELFENALDAKATNIDVKLERNGLEKIEVRDNGCGIKESDTNVMAQRFYTSKISKHEDLCCLSTYGFRGEALGSLCQVSDVSITTKTPEDDVAVCYSLNQNGEVVSKKPTHEGNGTTVVAGNIFKNLPVRKQFYNNPNKCKEEVRKIEDILMAYGFINPEIRLSLKNNKVLVWQKNKSSDIRRVVIDILGLHISKQVEYFEYTDTETSMILKCFLPKLYNNSTQQSQKLPAGNRCFTFVNNRYIKWKELIQVVKKHFCITSDRKNDMKIPFCLISLQLPSEDVDANLEPNKTKVLVKQKETVLEIFSKQVSSFYEKFASCDITNSTCTNEVSKMNDNVGGQSGHQNNESNDDELEAMRQTKNETEKSSTITRINSNMNSEDDNVISKFNDIVEKEVLQNNVQPLPNGNSKDLSSHSNLRSVSTSHSPGITDEKPEDGNPSLDWTVFDDIDFGIDFPLSDPEQWSKGHNLCDKNGNDVQPTNILMPMVQPELTNGNTLSVLNGKRKSMTSLPSLKTPCKRIKKHSKIAGQASLMDSLLQSTSMSMKKIAETRKRTLSMEVSFSLSSMGADSIKRKDCSTPDDTKLIKRLDPWGVWIVSRNRKLYIVNPYRLKELLLYKRLMANHIITREKLGNPIILNERILGSVTRYSFLGNIVMNNDKNIGSDVSYCNEKCLVANGFEICGKKDIESGKARLSIVKMNTTIPYFGVQDLIEILDMMKVGSQHRLNNNLHACRPSKVVDYLKNEVVRVTRDLSSKLTEHEMKSLLVTAKKELEDEESKCIHGLPFLHQLVSY